MNKLLVSDGKLKYLEPGIYCATVKYEYGNTLVGNTIINDGTRYGDRTDTIEVEISKGKFGRGDYLSAFIMNNRMDIYSLPESPDSLTIDEHGESITYLPSSYLVPSNGEISEGFSDMFVKLNGHFFSNMILTSLPKVDDALPVKFLLWRRS